MLRNALSLGNDDTNRLAPNWGLSTVSDQSSFEDGPDTTGRVATHGKHEVDLSLYDALIGCLSRVIAGDPLSRMPFTSGDYSYDVSFL